MADQQGNEQSSGSRRRDVLKAAGLAAAAVGASQVVGETGAAASPAAAPGSSGPSVQLNVVDFVDGYYVLEARAQVAGTALSAPLRLRDGLRLELPAAAGTITEDPYTGEILLKPVAGQQIAPRAVLPADRKS